jgi:uracil permease
MVVVSLVLVCGIGGMSFCFGACTIKGIGLAGILGVTLNLILPPEPRRPRHDHAVVGGGMA